MRFIKGLIRLLIISPIYGLVITIAFVFIIWVLLKVLILLSEILLGVEPAWNIPNFIVTKAFLIASVLIYLGSVLNIIVFVANGFKMPVKDLHSNIFLHCPLDCSTRLPWLADIIPTPLGGRLSIGDIFLFIGIAIVIIIIVL